MGDKVKLEIHCTFCAAKETLEVELPNGAAVRHDTIYEDGFCEKHKGMMGFLDSQCVGCVSGWGECSLYRSFMFEGASGLSEDQMNTILNGYCPCRCNGTMTLGPDGLGSMNLSDKADEAAAKCMYDTIIDYCDRYMQRKPWELPKPYESPFGKRGE